MTPLSKRLLAGASGGLAAALLALGVGLASALVGRLRGIAITLPATDDLLPVACYIGGFALAGAILSGGWPLLRTRRLKYCGFMLAGTVVGLAIAAGDPEIGLGAEGLIIAVLVGSLMGLAAGYGFIGAKPLRRSPGRSSDA